MRVTFFQFWFAIFSLSFFRLCVGGDDSNSTQTTTNNFDQRQVNTNNITNTVDGGAIQGTIGLASQVVALSNQDKQAGYQFTENMAGNVLHFADGTNTKALDFASGVLDFAKGNDQRALSVQSDALHTLQSAYADAKGTTDSQSKIILGMFALIAVITLAKGKI